VPPERLGSAEVDAVAALLARAFADDPLLVYVLGPRAAAELRLIFGALVRDAVTQGEVWGVADGAATLAAAAVWLPPGTSPPGLRRQLRHAAGWARLARLQPRAMPRLLRVSAALDALHPPEPHWFLSLLGVEPDRRRGGLGGELVRAGDGRT